MQFTETQRFRQWWIWIAATAIALVSMLNYTRTVTVSNGEVIKDDSSFVWTFAIVPVVVLFVLFIVQLQTRYDEKGISYRFFPFQIQYQFRGWEEIERAFVREYKPLREYGGWGIRIWPGRSGMAYTISGSTGLQLVYKNGKRFLLGTQKKEELESFMKEVYEKGIVKDKEPAVNIGDRY